MALAVGADRAGAFLVLPAALTPPNVNNTSSPTISKRIVAP
jgi:hypothetical protein